MPKGVEHWDWDVDAGGFRYGVESLMPKGVEHQVDRLTNDWASAVLNL